MRPQKPLDLATKFRALSRELRARLEAARVGGKHSTEKGLRYETILRDFLARLLPARFGLSRGELVAANGATSGQIDLVVYDALHAPLLRDTEASMVFPAESVYAAVAICRDLTRSDLGKAVFNIASAKALPRSAIFTPVAGRRYLLKERSNPLILGAIFAFAGADIRKALVPALRRLNAKIPMDQRTDLICVLDEGVIHYYGPLPKAGPPERPTDPRGDLLGSCLAGQDSLLLFYLRLLHELNIRDLFPPDLLIYAGGIGLPHTQLHASTDPV